MYPKCCCTVWPLTPGKNLVDLCFSAANDEIKKKKKKKKKEGKKKQTLHAAWGIMR
jgi:hypothetical protein